MTTYRIRQTDCIDTVVELNKTIFPRTGAISQEDLDNSQWWVAEASVPYPECVDRLQVWEPVAFAGVRMAAKGAYMTRAGVLAEHRGHGLQQRLIRVREQWARAHGAQRIYTYVWVGNIASMRSLNKLGYLPYFCERVEECHASYLYVEKRFYKAA